MNEVLLKILMSWAVMLSPYPAPDVMPEVQYKPKAFFVKHACKGNPKCDIWGWYNDEGIVYLIDWMDEEGKGELPTVYINSFGVHELSHYLQDINGAGGTTCADLNRRERQSYYIQRKFLVAHGVVPVVSTKLHLCKEK